MLHATYAALTHCTSVAIKVLVVGRGACKQSTWTFPFQEKVSVLVEKILGTITKMAFKFCWYTVFQS